MSDDIVRDEMDDWWAWHKQIDDEVRQIEETAGLYNEQGRMLNRTELHNRRHGMRVEPQDDFDLINGTSLQGSINATYYDLVRAFGEPMRGDGYKTRAEWVLVFKVPQDGDEPDADVVASIYDWKKYDQEVFSVTTWNIGGMNAQAADLVRDYVNYVNDMHRMDDYIEAKSRVKQTA